MSVNSFTAFGSLGEVTSTFSHAAIAANVGNIEDARVVISLETHQNPVNQLFHARVLSHLASNESNKPLVLVEDSTAKSPEELSFHHQLSKVDIRDLDLAGWDHPESVEQSKKVSKRIAETRKAIDLVLSKKPFQAIEEFYDAYLTLMATENYFKKPCPNEKKEEFVSPLELDQDSPDFHSRMMKLSESGERLNNLRISHLVRKTFAKRQASLIDTLNNYADKRIFLIAGRWHGNQTVSPFPRQVEKLVDYLGESTTFMVLDSDLII